MSAARVRGERADRAPASGSVSRGPEPGGATPAAALRALSLGAFCTSRSAAYHRYAALRLGSAPLSRAVVEQAFADLAGEWPSALRAASPAAIAWSLLTARTDAARSAPRSSSGPVGGLYRLLPGPQADAVVLSRCLRFSHEEAAEILGVNRTQLLGSLRAAHRTLKGTDDRSGAAGIFP
jgi:hypothetical protein